MRIVLAILASLVFISQNAMAQAEDLSCDTKCLDKRVQKLEETVKVLTDQINQVKQTANNALPNGAGVILRSHYSALNKCLWQPNYDNVNAVDCNDALVWRLEKKTNP